MHGPPQVILEVPIPKCTIHEFHTVLRMSIVLPKLPETLLPAVCCNLNDLKLATFPRERRLRPKRLEEKAMEDSMYVPGNAASIFVTYTRRWIMPKETSVFW
jgi:hypothetical protein